MGQEDKRKRQFKKLKRLLLKLAKNRIIVTTDKGLEEMIWRQRKSHCGVLPLENLPRRERLELINILLDRPNNDLKAGAIVVAYSTKFLLGKLRKPQCLLLLSAHPVL